jgi:hypothetical protein
MTGLRWSRRTTTTISQELGALGISVSPNTVARLLHQMGYSLRVNPYGVRRIDVVGHYEGYDEDGDGHFLDWHRYYAHDRKGPGGADEPQIRGHIGSALKAPFQIRWNTHWVPDHRLPVVQLAARIQSQDGLWYVTDPVGGLRIERRDVIVRLYKPERVPERFCVRVGIWMLSAFHVPGINPEWKPIEARLHLRTWNGHGQDVWVNGWKTSVRGGDHVFAYTEHDLPVETLRQGDNRVEFYSETAEHCIEVLWPGPGVTVRYGRSARPPQAAE